MTGKQRAGLRAMANGLETILYIGKEGITEGTVKEAYDALEAARRFAEAGGAAPAVYDMRYLKPLDTGLLDAVAARFGAVVTVEDGCLKGGLYGAVCEYLAGKGQKTTVRSIGIPDRFIPQARQSEERRACGTDAQGILAELQKLAEKD